MPTRLIVSLLVLGTSFLRITAGEEDLPNLPRPVEVHALTHARIAVAARMRIEEGTIIIRDGVIQAVGERARVPADARIWDLTGKTIYAGLIDAYTDVGLPSKPTKKDDGAAQGPRQGGPTEPPEPTRGPVHEVSRVRPERRAADGIRTDAKTLES